MKVKIVKCEGVRFTLYCFAELWSKSVEGYWRVKVGMVHGGGGRETAEEE